MYHGIKTYLKIYLTTTKTIVSQELQEDKFVKINKFLIKTAFPVKCVENEIKKLENSKFNVEEINIITQKVQYIEDYQIIIIIPCIK